MESEDVVSVFNLSFLPDSRALYFAFSLKVPTSVNGGDPNSWVDVGFRAILLGWSGADMVTGRSATSGLSHRTCAN